MHAQVLRYDVVKGSRKLGEMSVERTIQGNSVAYKIESRVVFRLLFTFTIDFSSSSEYENGKLMSEYTHNELNGKTQKKSKIWYERESYILELDGVRSFHKEEITYSVASIYYREPKDKQKVYSPQFGNYLTFKEVEDHAYKMESPDGINIYMYTHGICTRVDINRDFAKFSFVMTPESLKELKQKNEREVSTPAFKLD